MSFQTILDNINGVLWHQYVLFTLLGVGLLFTIWTKVGQFAALTHGVACVRGVYSRKDDPGAINHFQALATALSGTVGLGNIAGVAVAVALGGPGAIFWMWIVGLVGMALKMTEVTLAMMYRSTEDPDNPHGGAMFVASKGFALAAQKDKRALGVWGGILFALVAIAFGMLYGSPSAFWTSKVFWLCFVVAMVFVVLGFAAPKALGGAVGAIFVVTLIISTFTGGNMFQAWNVAAITTNYFPSIPPIAVGIIIAVIVGSVIIGGIKRIGAVTGRLVPFMCVLYLLAAFYVLIVKIDQVPAMLGLIFRSAVPPSMGGSSVDPQGAFLGGTFGYAFLWGMKRALFSNEAGQGSSPIAHSAAKTEEPVREGVVAGLEPFVDTIVVCTLTALVMLASGAWDRDAAATYPAPPTIVAAADAQGQPIAGEWVPDTTDVPVKRAEAVRTSNTWRDNDGVFILVTGEVDTNTGREIHKLTGSLKADEAGALHVVWEPFSSEAPPVCSDPGLYMNLVGAALTGHAFDRVTPGLGMWIVTTAAWLFAISTIISWYYYGEQGIYFLFGKWAVVPYKLVYCALIIISTLGISLGFMKTDKQLDDWTALGTGVMLFANIPIMLAFGYQAMGAYRRYFARLRAGEFHPHRAHSATDIMEGKDLE